MNHRTTYPVLYLCAAVLLLTAACQPPSAALPATAAAPEPVVIGASLPLTGFFEAAGAGVKQGYEVWASLVNDEGGLLGRPVELLILDNASEDAQAAADYEHLITVEQVDLLLGTFSSRLVIASSTVAAEHGYAYIEPAGGSPEVFNRGLNNLFFVQPAASARQADPFALYILGLSADARPRTFATVTQDDPYTLGIIERLTGLLLDGGLEQVFAATYPPEATDLGAIAAQVAALDPDMILGGTHIPDTLLQIQAYRAAGYQPRVAYFTSGPAAPIAFRSALGPATEGILSSISWFADAQTSGNREFVLRYLELFGGELGDIPEDAANGFTVGQVLQQAVAATNSLDNAVLIEQLHQGSFDTVVGPLSFDETGAPLGSFMLLQWQADHFVIVVPTDRAEADPLGLPKPAW